MPTTKAPPRRGKGAVPLEGKPAAHRTGTKAASSRKLGTQTSSRRTGDARTGATRTRAKQPTADEGEAVIFETSSGNVFADMGARDAEERLAKAELARIVRGLVRERQDSEGWTQARAARTLGLAAGDLSNLLRGKLAGFSQERLAQFLTRLGMDVRIQVAPRRTGQARATVIVERVAALS